MNCVLEAKSEPVRADTLRTFAEMHSRRYDIFMDQQQELMSASDVHAFGIEIVYKQLVADGWSIESADVLADINSEPQIVANKDGDRGFFVVRTDVYPKRGRFDEGMEAFETLVRHAKAHGADCFFASVGIANSEGKTEEEMSVPVKGVGYNVTFEGLIKMDLPENATKTRDP